MRFEKGLPLLPSAPRPRGSGRTRRAARAAEGPRRPRAQPTAEERPRPVGLSGQYPATAQRSTRGGHWEGAKTKSLHPRLPHSPPSLPSERVALPPRGAPRLGSAERSGRPERQVSRPRRGQRARCARGPAGPAAPAPRAGLRPGARRSRASFSVLRAAFLSLHSD